MRRLRLSMWSSAVLAIILQAAFLLLSFTALKRWMRCYGLFFVASVVCSIMFVYASSQAHSVYPKKI